MEVATARVAGAPWVAGDGGAINRLRSDRSLAERFQAGDETAFATIYDRYRARVNAICIGVLGSREDALDATQEVFATVALKLREEPPRELKPWLAKVARNAAVDIARKRRPTVDADEQIVAVKPSNGQLELQELVSALRDLPEQQRTALVMRELGGWNYHEIGASMGVDGDAVNGLIARARLGLRAHREAAALVCSAVRESLAGEEDGRRRAAPIRRHLRACQGCQEFNRALQSDSQTLRALLPGSGLGVLAVIAALRPRPALIGGLGALKVAFTGASAPIVAVCAVGACTMGTMSALDVLPPLPEALTAEKKDKDKDNGKPKSDGEPQAAPTAFSATVVAGAGDATVHAKEVRRPAADRLSIARPGPEGRVPADQPERLDPARENGGRGQRGGGPAPFDFGFEREEEYTFEDYEDFEDPRPDRGGRHHQGPGGGDDFDEEEFDDGGGGRGGDQFDDEFDGDGGGDRGGRNDGPRGGRNEVPHGGRDRGPRHQGQGGGGLPEVDDEIDIPEFKPEPRDGGGRDDFEDFEDFEDGGGRGGHNGPGGGDHDDSGDVFGFDN